MVWWRAMKKPARYALIIVAALCAGCASAPTGRPVKKAPVERATDQKPYDFRAEGEIPPLPADAANEPDVQEIGVKSDSAIDVTEAEVPPDTAPAPVATATLVDGFRVQVLASADRDVAENASREARERLGLPSYVDMDGGVYKVRVGDFVTRPDADRALAGVRKQYPDAWVVASKVRSTAGQ
jgi:hypothetical protein